MDHFCCSRCPPSSASTRKVRDLRPDIETPGLAPSRGSAPPLPGLIRAPDRCVSNCASRNRRIRIRARLACGGVRARGRASKDGAAGAPSDREGAEGPHHELFGRPARAAQRAAPGTRGAGTRRSLPSPGRSLWKVIALSRGVSPGPRGRGMCVGMSSRGREGKGAPRPRTCPYLPSAPHRALRKLELHPTETDPRRQSARLSGAAASFHL